MLEIISAILILGGIAIVLGFILIIVGKRLAPREGNGVADETAGTYPGANCGGERLTAQVMCSGTRDLAAAKYEYHGIPDCASATLPELSGGAKDCPHGCLGLGTCGRSCKFGAIHIINGVAAVDFTKCTACGECVHVCPKGIIRLIPFGVAHWVGCSSTDKPAVTRARCKVGCDGCKRCVKACMYGAMRVKDNLASIDYSKCTGCGKCQAACPRHTIWSSKIPDTDIGLEEAMPRELAENK